MESKSCPLLDSSCGCLWLLPSSVTKRAFGTGNIILKLVEKNKNKPKFTKFLSVTDHGLTFGLFSFKW